MKENVIDYLYNTTVKVSSNGELHFKVHGDWYKYFIYSENLWENKS